MTSLDEFNLSKMSSRSLETIYSFVVVSFKFSMSSCSLASRIILWSLARLADVWKRRIFSVDFAFSFCSSVRTVKNYSFSAVNFSFCFLSASSFSASIVWFDSCSLLM